MEKKRGMGRIELPENIQKELESIPESGMGFHIVDLELLDGTVLKNRIILNGTYLKLDRSDPNIIKQIKQIK